MLMRSAKNARPPSFKVPDVLGGNAGYDDDMFPNTDNPVFDLIPVLGS